MARSKGTMPPVRGKIGNVVVRQTEHGTVVSSLPGGGVYRGRRTLQSQAARAQFATLGKTYCSLRDVVMFEQRRPHQGFLSANQGVVCIYLTRRQNDNYSAVLAPYRVSEGRLPTIVVEPAGDGLWSTNLAVGNLVVDGGTTVAALSKALIGAGGDRFRSGDLLVLGIGIQLDEDAHGNPSAEVIRHDLKLSLRDARPLSEVLEGDYLAARDGQLILHGMPDVGAFVLIHRREGEKQVRLSTQSLVCTSQFYTHYQTPDAMRAAAESYHKLSQ